MASDRIRCVKFLDNETYRIFTPGKFGRIFINVSDDSVFLSRNKKTAFHFSFGHTGYRIDHEGKYLSFRYDENCAAASLYLSDSADDACEWAIEAYDEAVPFSGISIRLSEKTNEKYLYFSGTSVLSENKTSCPPFFPECLSGWILFGSIYMQYLGWIRCTDSNVSKTIRNYAHNMALGLSRDNNTKFNDIKVIINQSGGNFPKLKFASVTMNHVICEVIAMCNLFRLSGYSVCKDDTDFFRLAAEFEISGLYKPRGRKAIVRIGKKLRFKPFERIPTKKGAWGSSPDKLHVCLDAHNIRYREYNINSLHNSAVSKEGSERKAIERFKNDLTENDIGIISMNFDILYQAIHTFCIFPREDKLQGVNVFSNHTARNNYQNSSASYLQRELYKGVEEILSQTEHSRYFTGLIVEKTRNL